MNVFIGELEYCLEKAKEIAEQYTLYHIASDDPRRAVDRLMETCKKYLKVNITAMELDVLKDQSAVWGSCIETKDGFDILHVQGLNYCWKRFVICKELFHVILSKDEYKNMNIGKHVEEVTLAFPDPNSTPSVPVMAEVLAEIAAMEFLFPYARRLEELAGPLFSGNLLDIAEKYKVPQIHVERYLSKTYMGILRPEKK